MRDLFIITLIYYYKYPILLKFNQKIFFNSASYHQNVENTLKSIRTIKWIRARSI